MALDYGRVYIERGVGAGNGEMRLACAKSPHVNVNEDALNIFHMMGDRRTSVSGIEIVIRKITVRDVFFKNETDFINVINNLRKLNKAGTMTLEWAKNDVPTMLEFWGDGTTKYTTMEVKYKTYKGGEKISPGLQTIFHARQIIFEQAG